jgi:hypothetical protein
VIGSSFDISTGAASMFEMSPASSLEFAFL